ncbi:MAG: hypothetical protein ACOCWO_05850 [Candidatus Muiribacteriaceae bacterium]
MFIFHFFLFIISVVLTTFRISLIRTRIIRMIYIASVSVFPLLFYKKAVTFSLNDIKDFFRTFSSLSDLCLILIAESVIVLIFHAILLSDSSYEKIKRMIILMPGTGALLGIGTSQIIAYNIFAGRPFLNTALISSVTTAVLLILCYGLVFLFFRKRTVRTEILLILCFMQLVVSMFLPLIASGVKVNRTNLAVDPASAIFTFIISAFFIYTGVKIKNIKKIFLHRRSE